MVIAPVADVQLKKQTTIRGQGGRVSVARGQGSSPAGGTDSHVSTSV